MSQALTFSRPIDAVRTAARRHAARARELARKYPREAIGLGGVGFVAAVALGSVAVGSSGAPSAQAAPPAPPPLILEKVAPEQALRINSEIPLASGPNPAAAPFAFHGGSDARAQALNCLASAVYYEAGNQGEDGERAVAQVVLNRVRHPAFPATVCGVVYQGSTRATGCQFTFTCDGSLGRAPGGEAWRRATKIAEEALAGRVFAPVGWATHYHANYVLPTWASSLAKNAIVGAHMFYRWSGGWGKPGAFNDKYAGREPNAAALRTAALAAPHVNPAAPTTEVAEAIKDIPGAEPLNLAPSMRGDKRVAVRFNLTARKASDTAVHEDYTKKFETSDNLKWALSGDTAAGDQRPLGKFEPDASSGAALGSSQR